MTQQPQEDLAGERRQEEEGWKAVTVPVILLKMPARPGAGSCERPKRLEPKTL